MTHRVSAAPGFLIDVKDTEDDLPSSTVTAIEQTPEGYLWVGTYNGLARYDGERFVTYNPINTPALSNARVQGLFVDVSGTLWISTFRGGLTSYRDGVFRREWGDSETFYDLHTTLATSTSNLVTFVTQFGEVLQRRDVSGIIRWKIIPGPNGSRPIFQCVDQKGTLWFLSRDGRLIRFAQGAFENFPVDNTPLANKRAFVVTCDYEGRIWIGAEGMITRWDGTNWAVMTPTNSPPPANPNMIIPMHDGSVWVLADERFRRMVGSEWVAEPKDWQARLGFASGRAMGAREDRNGGLWLNHYGNGLFHAAPDGHFERFTTLEGLPGDRVGACYQSHDGTIWLGVDHGGLVRLRERRFQVIGKSEGLPVRTALSVCEDGEGAVWIGTGGGGLCRWSNGVMTRFPIGDHVSANFVFSVYPRLDGGFWLSAGEGEDLFSFRGGQLERAPWDVHGVKSILADQTGRVWVGMKAGLGWYSYADRRLFSTNDGVALSAVRALAAAPDGAVWCGADDGALYRCEADSLNVFRASDSLSHQPILSLLIDQDGTVWVGTFQGGLLRYKHGEFFRFTVKQGLPGDMISQLLEDGRGRIWLGTPQGIFNVAKSALIDCAEGKTSRVDCGRLDGLPTLECSDGYQPACWRGGNGQLWFTTVKGVISANPDELATNAVPAPVLIEEMWADGESIPLTGGRVKIPPGRTRYEFRYTALSFEATRFRYQIEGYDSDWVEAGTRRGAQYSHLAAGNYRFRVIASDDKGVWNKTGANLAFTIQPFFYQTRWFIGLLSVAIIGGIVLSVRGVAARKFRRQLARLEQQHAIERDRARIAKDIHDDIGAGLTQITLLSELARREKEQTGVHLERISSSARELTRAMDEIVWAVDPQHDTFIGLMDYISAYAEDFLRVADVRCRMDLPNQLPEIHVDAELRYNLFLALKETLNNIVKHAGATEVWLRLRVGSDSFSLVIEDNGKGLGALDDGNCAWGDRLSSGSGLSNLSKRLESIGGHCNIESVEGRGTRVTLTIKSLPAH